MKSKRMERKSTATILAVLVSVVLSVGALAQKINPVDIDPKKPKQPTLHYFDKHGNALEQPVLFLSDLDTVQTAKPGPVYPLWQSVSIGFNFFDGIMKLAGQKHASFDVWASVSLHNWIQPVVEAGIGYGDDRPDGANFRYKAKPSFYAKLGVDYNFLYKSNPDYQVHFGLRGGFSSFRYDITDVTVSSDYWDQTNVFSIPGQKAHALYGEILGGIRVKIAGPVSMGWDFRYRFMMKKKNGSNSVPWFIPGYGATNPIGASFSIIWTVPLQGKKEVPASSAGTGTVE